ncbi:multidrug-resistance type transporter aminotriazole resistance [Cyanidiococcus yangmingshanensis]|uniref:Multidrug-resistance type transporter aminotriazole resistance n=1 Tax=Cyanidiococcus yangmingshanensis TaxID=2690220 RepID=A0A7J7II92_9RHOD|nr:multidrug-resistance type transporter aminotriazole resistance [Cyanidiococcus yangmingshanensis]
MRPNEIECAPIWIIPWLLEPQNADERQLMLKFIEHLWQYPVFRPYLARWLCLTETGAGFVEIERLMEHLEWSAELLASVPVTVLQSSASVLFQRLIAIPEPSWPQLRCLALLLDCYAQTELHAPLMNEANATAFVRCVAWTWQGPATALPAEEPLVAQVLATLIRHSCRVENSPVVVALLRVLDQSMRTSLGQERFLAALGVIARHGCSRLITVIIAALAEQATLLEQRRKAPGHEKSVVLALDRIALELERIASPHRVRKLLLEHGPQLFPLLLDTMLRSQETITLIQRWLELPDATAVFACVYRLSFVFLIKHLQESRLRALQQRAAALSIGPEEQALAVAESLTMSSAAHRQRAWTLLESITGTQVKVIARTQCTRIILYLLSELGSRSQSVITTALEQIAFLVEAGHVGQLVSRDLLRLLDTLNRRIFKRQDPEAVRILPFLFNVVQQELHLFVPKILATLKNALELTGQQMQEAVLQAWIAFLKCLGWERAAPHLGTMVAILGPFLERERELTETLLQLISACAASSSNEFLDEIFLSAPVQSGGELVSTATIQVGIEQHGVAPERSAARAVSVAQEDVSSGPAVLAPAGHANDTHALQTNDSAGNGTCALSAIRTLLERRRQARTLNEQLGRLLPVATTHHSRMVRLLALREVSQIVQHHRGQLYIDLLLHQNTRLVSELLHRGLLVAATDSDKDCRQEALSALALLGAIDPARLQLGHNKTPSPTTQSSESNVIEAESFIDDTVIPTLLEQCLIPALRRVESSQAREWQNRIGFAIQEVLRLAMDTTSSREQAASVSLMNETSKQRSMDECACYAFWHALSEQARQIIRPFLHSRYILRSVVLKGTSEETQKDQAQAAHSAPVGSFDRTVRVTLDRAQLLPSEKRLEQATTACPAGDTNGSCQSNEHFRPQDLEPSQIPRLSAVPENVTGCTRCAIVPGITAVQWICTFAVHLADVLDQLMNETSTLTETSRSLASSEPQRAPLDQTHRRWWGLFRACRSLMGHDRNTAVYLLPHLVQVLLQLSSDLDTHGVEYVSQVLDLDPAHRPKPMQQGEVADVPQRETLSQSSKDDLPAAHDHARHRRQAEAVAASAVVSTFASSNEQAVVVTSIAQPGWITAMTAFLRAHLVCVLSSDLNEAIQLVFLLLDRLAERRDRHWMIHVRDVEPPKLSVGEYAALATAAAQEPAQVCPFNALEAGLPAGLLARAAVTSGALHRALLYLDQSKSVLQDDERRLAQRLYRELGEFDAMQAVAFQRLPSLLDSNRDHSSWPASNIPGSQPASLQPSLSDLECFTLDAEAHHAPDEALIGYEQRLRQCPHDSETQRGYLQCLQALGLWETMLNHVLAHPDMQSLADLGIEAALRLAQWDALETLSQPVDGQERGNTAYMVSVARALEQARANRDELLPETLRQARVALSETVAAAALESYTRTYPAMVRLHAVAEVESVLGVDDIEAVRHYVRELVVAPHGVTNWMQCRLDCVALTWQAREPILVIQRAALLVQG